MSNRLKRWFQRQFAVRPRTIILAVAVAAGIALILVVDTRLEASAWAKRGAAVELPSIMTFNIVYGGRPAGEALDAIAGADPDMLCLEELTPGLAALFEKRFAETYPHRFFAPRKGAQGIGLASRYPLSNAAQLPLGQRFLPAVTANVKLNSGEIQVACLHLLGPHVGLGEGKDLLRRIKRNESIRVGQVEHLLEYLDSAGLPAIVLGDMNEWPNGPALSVLGEAGFTDACRGSNPSCGPTWPGGVTRFPAVFRIDHILGRGVEFADAAVLEAGGSDHYPVAARIVISDSK